MCEQADGVAVLSSHGNYTTFSYNGRTLTFRTCSNLERFEKVILWDKGYIEVLAKYSHCPETIEEYIDLEPVLAELHMDKDEFLAPIRAVRIEYV